MVGKDSQHRPQLRTKRVARLGRQVGPGSAGNAQNLVQYNFNILIFYPLTFDLSYFFCSSFSVDFSLRMSYVDSHVIQNRILPLLFSILMYLIFFHFVQMCWVTPQCEKVVLTMGKPILIYSAAKKIK